MASSSSTPVCHWICSRCNGDNGVVGDTTKDICDIEVQKECPGEFRRGPSGGGYIREECTWCDSRDGHKAYYVACGGTLAIKCDGCSEVFKAANRETALMHRH